ncbi:AAA family ATPase [Microaerobacter geothermalis]|uniref:ExeA family protein n=1 Tax=Microaerobacter geothermalis TaxID=674972 RepID=UPI001F3B6721|nr:AAA family ATPase [Microaerobacter geothermalis]MCF6092537.1 AAA family ATPase [Microaerobacter geothermalis]
MNTTNHPSAVSPFSRELDPAFCYPSRGYQEALARLELMVEKRYLGVLTGEVGSGKSTLIRRLFTQLNPMVYTPIYISMAGLKPRDFYGILLSHVGEEPVYSVAKAKRLWEEVLYTRNEQGERTLVIIIDEAQEMKEAMMMELRFVMNHQIDSCSLFPLILVGQPELRKTLRLKKYEATAQRIGLQYHLSGLSKEETHSYIRHQLKVHGIQVPIFSESALQRIYAASQGIPRVINHICSQALYEATNKNHEVIEESHIGRVLTDLDRQRGITG